MNELEVFLLTGILTQNFNIIDLVKFLKNNQKLHIDRKNEFKAHFEQNFTTGSYGVGIGRAWCSQKACEICSSLVLKEKLKK
jgi:hypothetical protein